MRLCRRSLSFLAIMLLAGTVPALGAKTAFQYDVAQRVIKACVLYVDQDTDPLVDSFLNSHPGLIEGLRRTDLCPDDWLFENPLADPAVVTGSTTYIVKGSPAYWRVDLTDDTAAQLPGMDLIYICAPRVDLLTEIQKAGLRRAVDNGALLWVDNDVHRTGNHSTGENETITTSAFGDFPWVFNFTFTSETPAQAASNIRIALDATHGILRRPYGLGYANVWTLGDLPDWGREGLQGDTTYDFIAGFDPAMFQTVVQFAKMSGAGYTTHAPNIIAGPYGSGSVVVTAGEVGADVTEWINNGLPGPNAQQKADVQLALNMIQWADRWEQARSRPSASASSVARAPMPLEMDWQYPGQAQPPVSIDPTSIDIGPVVGTPVCSRGMVFAVTTGSASGTFSQLLCFDGEPKQDLDLDGRPDDGLIDYSVGASHDLIWAAPLLGTPRASSACMATINVLDATNTFDVPILVALVSTVVLPPVLPPWQGHITCYNATIDPNVLAQLPAAIPGTGGVIWSYNITGFDAGNANVVALSTPVVHNGWVYALATEYDGTLLALDGKATERVYGRAHCIDLATGGDALLGANWQYPTPVADIDGDGGFAGGPEDVRSLPPFHDPEWAALAAAARPELPPEPGAMPVVTQAVDTVRGRPVEALLTFGTATSHRLANGAVRTYGGAGGSEVALVPSPQRVADDVVLLNNEYNIVTVNRLNTPAGSTTRLVANGTQVPGVQTWLDTRMIVYNPATVREMIANLVSALGEDPIALQQRVAVEIDYTATAAPTAVTDEPHFLPGPMRWRHEFGPDQRRANAGSIVGDQMIVSTGVPAYYTGNGGRSGLVTALDANTGAERWTYDPLDANPVPVIGVPTFDGMTAPAFDGDTAIVGATLVGVVNPVTDTAPTLTSAVIGLKSDTDCTIYLHNGGGDPIGSAEDDVEVRIYSVVGETIDPSCYLVDRYGWTITFPADKAAKLTANSGNTKLGAIYGRAIQVAWTDDTGTPFGPELHVVPDIERFRLVAPSRRPLLSPPPPASTMWGYIRLRHYPVLMDTTIPNDPIIHLLDGTPVPRRSIIHPEGWSVVNHFDPTDPDTSSIDGWIVMPEYTLGQTVEVEYNGFFERGGGIGHIPNPLLNLPPERHQVPGAFGPSVSSPVIAGTAIHMGTEGFKQTMDPGPFDDPIGPGGMYDTMLSLTWDKATGYVRSALSRAAWPNAGYGAATVPVVTSSPSVVGERVFVGSQLMTSPANPSDYGFVSGLKPRRALVCDTTRLVMTTGTEPSWTCTGTSGPQRLQSFVGEDLRRPFSRPAKATQLGSGNLLVVDAGNNRVVEIDRAGRLVWPKDRLGFEYYTSSANSNLRLSRPADAHRYVTQETVPGGGATYTVWHTIIADTGNARVIDVQTILVDPSAGYRHDGRQRHVVVTVTPSGLRLSGGARAVRVRYTAAQPIFDPGSDELNGYLCAAANLSQVVVVAAGSRVVNPVSNTIPPSGNGTWARWAWLYDANPTDTTYVSDDPLLFRNIKHVEYVRYDDTQYVTVTCSRYDGRASAGGHALAAAGPGVFEFQMNVGGLAGTWGLNQALGSWDEPYWHFVAGATGSVEADGYNYGGGAMRPITTIVTDAGNYRKRWFPVCAKRLMSGRHLIVNNLSQIEHVTHENLGALSRNGVLGSHVFELESTGVGDNDPYNDLYNIPGDRSIPEPGQAWSDPISQPTYAEML